jgi:TolB-like protein/Flp pilus assembly protein TadD
MRVLIVRVLSVLALVVAVAWFIDGGGYEAVITAIVGLAGLFSVEFLKPDRREVHSRLDADTQSKEESVPDTSWASSIVVLPFHTLSPDPADAYFSDGLTEELITHLSYLRSLRVISRNSAMVLKGTPKDTRTIATELDVQYVLEGSVRKDGDDLRITAQLIDAGSDTHLWAEKYDGRMESVFSVQETVARSIVESLGLVISPEESKRLLHRPIDNLAAYQCYLRARQGILLWTAEGMEHARRQLEQGLDLVGENAALLYGLALIEQESVQAGLKSDEEAEESLEKVPDYAARILQLDPNSPYGHSLLGIHHHWLGNFPEAVHHYQRVLEVDPANPDVLWGLSVVLWSSDNIDAAEPLIERFVQTDPLSPRAHDIAGFIRFSAGRFQDAVEATDRAFKLEPENHQYRLHHVLMLIPTHRFEEAGILCTEVRSASPENVDQWHLSVFAAAFEDDPEEVGRIVEASPFRDLDLDEHSCFQVALAYHLVGGTEEALEWLERGIERGHIGASVFNGFFGRLQGDPRFDSIVTRAKEKSRRFSAELGLEI